MSDIDKLLEEKRAIRLDIGCGNNKESPDWVGIDYRKLKDVDIVQDLEQFPWALPDECVSVAVCKHVVEHINPARGVFIDFMNEAWRVLKPGGQLAIVTPYAGSPGYYQDPTHCNPCNEVTWSYFDPLDNLAGNVLYSIYKPKPWKVEMRTWHASGNLEVLLSKRKEDKSYE